jgi:hypothetical protein
MSSTQNQITAEALAQLATSISELRGAIEDMHAGQQTALTDGFVTGVTKVLQDDELMDQLLVRLLGAFGKYATKTTGKWTLDQLRAIPGRVIVWGLILAILWQVGGVAAVVKFLAAVSKTAP